jgi:hypothetical protein
MNIIITLLSVLGIAAIWDYSAKEQRCKNAKKGYGKSDLKELVSKGFFDKSFMKN